MKKTIVVLFLLAQFSCCAESVDVAHFAEHFGTSYALSAAVYGFAEKGMHCKPEDAFIFAAVTTLMVGVVYKFSELSADPRSSDSIGRAMLENTLGIAGWGFTAVMFKF